MYNACVQLHHNYIHALHKLYYYYTQDHYKIYHFYLYLPGALFYTDKTWFKLKVLLKETTWFLFEVYK